jgi:hypothetical protein
VKHCICLHYALLLLLHTQGSEAGATARDVLQPECLITRQSLAADAALTATAATATTAVTTTVPIATRTTPPGLCLDSIKPFRAHSGTAQYAHSSPATAAAAATTAAAAGAVHSSGGESPLNTGVTRLQTVPVTGHNSQIRATARDYYSARGSARSLSPLSGAEGGAGASLSEDDSPSPHGDPHGELLHSGGLKGGAVVPGGTVPMLALGQRAAASAAAVGAYTASLNR